MADFNLVLPAKVNQPIQRRAPEALSRRAHPKGLGRHHDLAPLYRPSPALAGAVNAALAVGAPLLLTGDPGTGKTQLAWFLAWYFQVPALELPDAAGQPVHHPQPFAFHVRSTSEATDLLYTFDTVAYFHESHTSDGPVDKQRFRTRGPLWLAMEAARQGLPAIVLIDEIDKAPRDFPNDLLHVLDQFAFTCQPTGEQVEVPQHAARPVVVITSNAEKRLPAPFLRRCVFHHIELDRPMVETIVAARADLLGLGDKAQKGAIDHFFALQDIPGIRRPPSTAELLVWLAVAASDPAVELDTIGDLSLERLPHLGVLLKDHQDRDQLA